MLCPTCGADCLAGQKFCMSCGVALGATGAEASAASDISSFRGFAPPSLDTFVTTHLPSGEPAVAMAATAPPPPAVDATPTGEIRIVEQTLPLTTAAELWDPVVASDPYQVPVTQTRAMPVSPVERDEPSRAGGALATLAGLAGLATIVGSFLPQVTVKSDAPVPNFLGEFKLNDFYGTNLQVAFIAAGIVLLLGAVLTASGKRFGRGLLGGAGLALVPAVLCVFGFVRNTIDVADSEVTRIHDAGGGGTYFDAQPGIGFYVLLAGAFLGLFCFVASLGRTTERSFGLNTALCGVGAIASIVAGIGQLIPQNSAGVGDNFSADLGNKAFIYGRVAMALLVAGCGVLGFLRKSRWGVGLALGGLALYAWQWLSSFAKLGDFPSPPAFFNPGGVDPKPHMLTTIGVIAMVLVGLLALALGSLNRSEATQL